MGPIHGVNAPAKIVARQPVRRAKTAVSIKKLGATHPELLKNEISSQGTLLGQLDIHRTEMRWLMEIHSNHRNDLWTGLSYGFPQLLALWTEVKFAVMFVVHDLNGVTVLNNPVRVTETRLDGMGQNAQFRIRPQAVVDGSVTAEID